MSLIRKKIVALLAVATLTSMTAAQEPKPTVWQFLGVSQGLAGMRNRLVNPHGNHPGLERKPPIKPIADPSHLKEGTAKIVKQAAQVKQQEDQKKQKIKAIKYLTRYGCCCYDREEKVKDAEGNESVVKPTTDALISALQDPTEEVRFATVRYIAWAADGDCCNRCGSKSCCNELIIKELARLAFDYDEFGCFVEPSDRVRKAAEDAVRACCRSTEPVNVVEPKVEEPPKKEEGEDIERETGPESPGEESGEPESIESNTDAPQGDEERPEDGDLPQPKPPMPDSFTSVPEFDPLPPVRNGHSGAAQAGSHMAPLVRQWQPIRPVPTPMGPTPMGPTPMGPTQMGPTPIGKRIWISDRQRPDVLTRQVSYSSATNSLTERPVKPQRIPLFRRALAGPSHTERQFQTSPIQIGHIDPVSGTVILSVPETLRLQPRSKMEVWRTAARGPVQIARLEVVGENGIARVEAGRAADLQVGDGVFFSQNGDSRNDANRPKKVGF